MSVVKRESGKANGTDSSLISSPHRLSIYKTSQGADFPAPDQISLPGHQILVWAPEPPPLRNRGTLLPPALAGSVLLALPFAPQNLTASRLISSHSSHSARTEQIPPVHDPFRRSAVVLPGRHSSLCTAAEPRTFSPLFPPRTSADGVKLGEHFRRNS